MNERGLAKWQSPLQEVKSNTTNANLSKSAKISAQWIECLSDNILVWGYAIVAILEHRCNEECYWSETKSYPHIFTLNKMDIIYIMLNSIGVEFEL